MSTVAGIKEYLKALYLQVDSKNKGKDSRSYLTLLLGRG